MASSPTVVVRTVAVVSMTGASALTVTCSCTPASRNAGFSVVVAPTVDRTICRNVAKPLSSIVTS